MPKKSSPVFSCIVSYEVPESLTCDEVTRRNPAFTVSFEADGHVPFPQIIIRSAGVERIYCADKIVEKPNHFYEICVEEGELSAGSYNVQFEGCKKAEISQSNADDWLKVFGDFEIESAVIIRAGIDPKTVKVHFGIHKHMHQPYYRAADANFWDGMTDGIFSERHGPYTHFIPMAVNQYIGAGLPHAGLSTSWSGSLIEQLNSSATHGRCGGAFNGWNQGLREIARQKTALGNPRCDFSAFGFFHPLMALVPDRDIIKQIEWHRGIIKETFGLDASDVLFPPETAFHARMIPAINKAGIRAVIYDSVHRFRSCKDYPYGGLGEGMLPPNQAEQENPPVDDWLQLQNVWAGSQISPQLLRPEYVKYEDADGTIHKTIAVPAERYIGNEDARGGFGALQYESVLGQVFNRIVEHGNYDPEHPPFFLLHSDGDNYGGGTDSYYGCNTSGMVNWLQQDDRFELTGVKDYLDRFEPDPSKAIHIEPGSWAGADNGDPQFMKWFSRYDQPYSPDLNSWAVLTALQNLVHSLEDQRPDHEELGHAYRLLMTAETSCYWYWTGQQVWDQQVTDAANKAIEILKSDFESIKRDDKTGPTIFSPWVMPENPGGQKWGNHCLEQAAREATVYSFIYDISGMKHVDLVLRYDGNETRIKMQTNGAYPCETGAMLVGDFYTAQLPVGLGDVRYYIEAIDCKGNRSISSLERVYLA